MDNNYYWKKQSKNKKNCGTIAVSIVAKCSIKTAEQAIGEINRTTTKELIKGLKQLRIKCDKRLKRKKCPKLAIAKLIYPNKKNWHWVVVSGDKIFDGIYGKRNGTVKWKRSWKITSYLEIYEK